MSSSRNARPARAPDTSRSYALGKARLVEELNRLAAEVLAFRPPLTGSQWADLHGYIPAGTSAEHGKIVLYGYQRGILDAMCDPRIPEVVVAKSARVGYTRLLTLALGYYIENEAALCVLAQPTTEDARDFGKTEVMPVLRDTPSLARLLRPQSKGEAQDTVTDWQFANGAVLRLRGAASDDAFRRYSARFLAGDEIDANGWSAGRADSQGDKIELLWKRGETFWNRKMILGSTPVFEETSRIWSRWSRSSQSVYEVPCPACSKKSGKLDGWQHLEWTDSDVPHGLKWERDEAGRVARVFYRCRHAGCQIDEGHKAWMDQNGRWRATNPDAEPGRIGFHIWTGMTLNPNAGWGSIVDEWLRVCKDPQKRQTFENLTLGRPYKPSWGQEIKAAVYLDRREAYEAEVPDGVRFLVLGADNQSSKDGSPCIEATITGIGAGWEQWVIGHWKIRGDLAKPEVWRELDRLIARKFRDKDGRAYQVQAATIDAGGHYGEEVFQYCAGETTELHKRRRVWPIRGKSEQRGERGRVWPRKPSTSKGGHPFYFISGNAARDFVFGSLAIQEKGPRRVHFPKEPALGSEPMDEVYFEELTADRLVHKRGVAAPLWETANGRRNEAADCLVYAYAAVAGLQALHRSWTPPAPEDGAAEERPAEQEPKRTAPGPAPDDNDDGPARPAQPATLRRPARRRVISTWG